jgi:hypothetical protein
MMKMQVVILRDSEILASSGLNDNMDTPKALDILEKLLYNPEIDLRAFEIIDKNQLIIECHPCADKLLHLLNEELELGMLQVLPHFEEPGHFTIEI